MIRFPVELDIYRNEPSGRRFIARIALPEAGAYKVGRSKENQIKIDFIDVSRQHAYIQATQDGFTVLNRSASGKTYIGGREIDKAGWDGRTPLRLGPTVEIVLASGPVPSLATDFEEQARGRQQRPPQSPDLTDRPPAPSIAPATPPPPSAPAPPAAPAAHMAVELPDVTTLRRQLDDQRKDAEAEMKFPGNLFKGPVVSIQDLAASGYVVGQCEYLSVGAGMGGFTWVDHLRLFGVPTNAIRAIGVHFQPYNNYKRYCAYSQIPAHERLRSNSISAPDNIWGFPGYASRETWRELKRLNLGGLKHVLKVFGEPAIAESFTPQIGDVYASIEREMKRIGWREMMIPGVIVAVRKTNDGRYAVAYRVGEEEAGGGQRGQVVIARYLQMATGYPGTRFTTQLEDFKRRFPGDNQVVGSYEPHDYIYTDAEKSKRPSVIILQGRGIVASRVIQRIFEARRENPNIQVVHLMRNPIPDRNGATWGRARRRVFNHTEMQPFNWPKAAWGGEWRRDLERATPQQRADIYRRIGGSHTAPRRDWIRIQRQGFAEGWYHVRFGVISAIEYQQEERRKLAVTVDGFDKQKFTVVADAIIDCTGLVGEVRNSPFLQDLLDTYQLTQNFDAGNRPVGFAVTNDFEVMGMQNLPGRVYAAGQITSGGPYAGVDSFLGLQYAALRSVDHLYESGAPWIRRFGPLRSSGQWLKWCVNARP